MCATDRPAAALGRARRAHQLGDAVALSLPGLPRERAGNRQGLPGGRSPHSSEHRRQVCSPWEGPRHPKQRVGFELREALLNRRQSPHTTARPAVENWLAPGVSWHLSSSTLNPSWRAPQQKHTQRPPYFANSVGPRERSGSPRAVPECWTMTQWPQEPPADSDRVRCCWPQATGFATRKFGKGRLGMSVHVELPLISRSPKGQRS